MIKHLQAKFWNWVWTKLEISDFVASRLSELEDSLRNELASNFRECERNIESLRNEIID